LAIFLNLSYSVPLHYFFLFVTEPTIHCG
jgi:hypothetical protein